MNKQFSIAKEPQNKNFENPITLKDGRILFTKNNGFEYFVRDTKNKETQITFEYYKKSQKHKIKL